MLVQLVLKNVLSFRDETVFTMAGEGDALETVAGVYGANAAGKSNLVKALGILQRLVTSGVQQDMPLPARPFALDGSRAEPCVYEIIVNHAGHRHEYVLSFDAQRIHAEHLFRDGQAVFEREAGELRFGSVWPEDERYLDFVRKGTRDNQPFLTEAASKNVVGANLVRDWFQAHLFVFGMRDPALDLPRLQKDENLRAFLGATLESWETGVREVRLTNRPLPVLEMIDATGKSIPELQELTHNIADLSRDVATYMGWELSLVHAGTDGFDVPLKLTEESDGTRRLLHLIPLLFDRTPRTIVIDELDRSLHAALTRRFVDDFRKANAAAAQPSQLIFTSHDTTLLTGALQKPEELWFAEKDKTGASTLYSLAEFKPEQLEGLQADLARGYLSGRFGAVPFPIPTGAPTWLKGTGS